jgi:hypothetical protein
VEVRSTRSRVVTAAFFILAGVGLAGLLSPLAGIARATVRSTASISDYSPAFSSISTPAERRHREVPQMSRAERGWWLSAKDGWVIDPAKKWRCTPRSLRHANARHRTICGTSDGGKHWRPVFLAPERTDASEDVSGLITAVLRWDEKNAVVSLWDAAVGWSQTWEFWTRDGGRHWWPTDVFHLGLSPVCYSLFDDPDAPRCTDPGAFFRRGSHLFFVVDTNYAVATKYYLLEGWPRTSPMPPCPRPGRGAGPYVCPATLDAGFVAVPG